ncbi:glutaredoxin family protein [Alteromonas sp. ASW11-36]|uniref:Glutaredoxin family protein n=1 Tax=Alteromonas arenosi TaxID=3055817 RepID=A0ABT7SXF9_9ALTE|nr:glutaredoxin family protein [Alteromonas sp. ASW11-36]MDM7860871.1 glutaredoxin family protein [Alteromonas sp. ASW11-36]
MQLILFTGPQCHLCDLALVELEQVHNVTFSVEKRNIRENPDDYHLYAVRIPVLKRRDNDLELGWPFTAQDIERFLQ